METIKTQTYDYGEQLGTLPSVRRLGYDFLGWFTEENSGDQIYPSLTVLKDATYYAHWTPHNYAIEYDMNGHGQIPTDANNTFTINDEYAPPEPSPVEGWKFDGWQPPKVLPGTASDFKFVAQWTEDEMPEDDNLLINEDDEILSNQYGEGLVYVDGKEDSILINKLNDLIQDENGNHFIMP